MQSRQAALPPSPKGKQVGRKNDNAWDFQDFHVEAFRKSLPSSHDSDTVADSPNQFSLPTHAQFGVKTL